MAIEITYDITGVEEFKAAMERFDSSMQRHVHERLANWLRTLKL